MSIEQSETLAGLSKALVAAQAQMEPLHTDAKNPHFQSSYATLAQCCRAAIPPLTAHGIAVHQGAGGDGTAVTVSTTLLHTSGEWIRSTLTLRAPKADPQGAGSAITYGRRYGLLAAVGLAPEDDDGTAASRPEQPPRERQRPPSADKGGRPSGSLPFGKYEGLMPSDPSIPMDYLHWLANQQAEKADDPTNKWQRQAAALHRALVDEIARREAEITGAVSQAAAPEEDDYDVDDIPFATARAVAPHWARTPRWLRW